MLSMPSITTSLMGSLRNLWVPGDCLLRLKHCVTGYHLHYPEDRRFECSGYRRLLREVTREMRIHLLRCNFDQTIFYVWTLYSCAICQRLKTYFQKRFMIWEDIGAYISHLLLCVLHSSHRGSVESRQYPVYTTSHHLEKRPMIHGSISGLQT